MNFFNMIRGWIPTGTEVQIGSITSAIGAVLTYFIGWNDALEALLTLMVIDYATGLLAAYINPDLKLDSHKGFRGICKKWRHRRASSFKARRIGIFGEI